MTDISYNTYCPTGLNLTSYSKRTCGRLYKTWGGCFSTTLIQCWRFTIQPYMWEDKGIPVGGGGLIFLGVIITENKELMASMLMVLVY